MKLSFSTWCLILTILHCAHLVSSAGLTWSILANSILSPSPAPRRDAAIGHLSALNSLILFGGRTGGGQALRDTWLFNLASLTWNELSSNSSMLSGSPDARFSMVYGVSGTGAFYICTGQTNVNGRVFSDTWIFSPASLQWSAVSVHGDVPPARYGSAGGFFRSPNQYLLFLTHGFDKNVQRFSDSYILDTTTREWSRVVEDRSSNAYDPRMPHARCLHSGVAIGTTEFLIFGGCLNGQGSAAGPCPSNDVWIFSSSRRSWKRGGQYSQSQFVPTPRVYSSMVYFALADTVLVYGGDTNAGNMIRAAATPTDEVILIDASDGNAPFRRRSASNPPPTVLVGASMTVVTMNNSEFAVLYGLSGSLWRLSLSGSLSDSPALSGSNSYISFVILHGVFAFIGWGVLLQAGALIARYGKQMVGTKQPALWFRLHRGLQITGLTFGLVAFVLGVVSASGAKHFSFAHGIIGLIITILGVTQPLNALFRPHPGTPKRLVWNYLHWGTGRLALILALANISLGLFLAVAPDPIWIAWFCLVLLLIIGYITLEIRRIRSLKHR
eukprot:ANDGO_07236.mRNA.2 Cytochrome b561 and DOMON domain-containing protein At3g61750